MSSNWTIPKRWPGETVFVIGGGPSVALQRPDRLRGLNVIAINSSYEVAPFAQYGFFGDNRWHEEHKARPDFIAFRDSAEIVTVSEPSEGVYLRKLERITPTSNANGISVNRKSLSSQWTSFQGAINLAAMLGAGRIVLLGMDGKRSAAGVSHHHKPHKWPVKGAANETWDRQKTQLCFAVAPLKAMGIETFNTNPDSAFDYWPYRPLEDFLPAAARPVEHASHAPGHWDRPLSS